MIAFPEQNPTPDDIIAEAPALAVGEKPRKIPVWLNDMLVIREKTRFAMGMEYGAEVARSRDAIRELMKSDGVGPLVAYSAILAAMMEGDPNTAKSDSIKSNVLTSAAVDLWEEVNGVEFK